MSRKPTERELAQAESHAPVYKVVRLGKDKKLLSLWVRGTKTHPVVSHDLFCKEFTGATITYGKGKLSGNGRYGIFCCDSLKAARQQARSNGHKSHRCRIYEALPLGKKIENNSSYGEKGTVLYPAIILGKRAVWSGLGGWI